MFYYLGNTNLNINVDVNVAAINPINNDEYMIFEVYNPAYTHGGTIRIKTLNVYKKSNGIYPSSNRGSKYWIRKDMSEVTFKSAVVVNYFVFIYFTE